MNFDQIIVNGAGVESSNGTYNKNANGWLISANGNHIEPTVDGWFLYDETVNEQTYMFSHDFTSAIAVGDGIEPVPEFEVI